MGKLGWYICLRHKSLHPHHVKVSPRGDFHREKSTSMKCPCSVFVVVCFNQRPLRGQIGLDGGWYVAYLVIL